MTITTIIADTVLLYLQILSIMIFVRVLFPLFADENGLLFSFVFTTTEPVMLPIRNFLDKTGVFEAIPVDFSGVFAMTLIMIVRIILMFFY